MKSYYITFCNSDSPNGLRSASGFHRNASGCTINGSGKTKQHPRLPHFSNREWSTVTNSSGGKNTCAKEVWKYWEEMFYILELIFITSFYNFLKQAIIGWAFSLMQFFSIIYMLSMDISAVLLNTPKIILVRYSSISGILYVNAIQNSYIFYLSNNVQQRYYLYFPNHCLNVVIHLKTSLNSILL